MISAEKLEQKILFGTDLLQTELTEIGPFSLKSIPDKVNGYMKSVILVTQVVFSSISGLNFQKASENTPSDLEKALKQAKKHHLNAYMGLDEKTKQTQQDILETFNIILFRLASKAFAALADNDLALILPSSSIFNITNTGKLACYRQLIAFTKQYRPLKASDGFSTFYVAITLGEKRS